jgi:hypothetical protein
MSTDTRLDERLRAALRTDDGWQPDVSLRDVQAEAARASTRRRLALAAAAAVVAVAGPAVAVGQRGSGGDAAPAVPTNPPSAVSAAAEGTWLSPPLSAKHIRRALEAEGFDAATVDLVVEDLGFGHFNRVSVRIQGGFVDTIVQHNDMADDELVDRQTYELDGDRLVLTPREGEGTTVLRVVTAGDRLTLDFVSTSEPDYRGIPAEALLRALYTTSWFT